VWSLSWLQLSNLVIASEAKQSIYPSKEWIASSLRSSQWRQKATYGLGLFYLFAQNLKLQPFFLGGLKILLRRRERG
jgi:hypothetical protein